MKIFSKSYNSNNISTVYKDVPSEYESEVSQTLEDAANNEITDKSDKSAQLEKQDILILSEAGKTQSANMPKTTGSLKDNSSALAQRLVAALVQFEVWQVIADINKDLASLRAMAAGNSKEAVRARAYVKKLEKLLNRGHRKISDLNDEDKLRIEQDRVKQQKEKAAVEKIKDELRKKQREREARERGYLLEDLWEKLVSLGSGSKDTGGIASEAVIAAQAKVIAAAETAAAGSGFSGEGFAGLSVGETPAADALPADADSTCEGGE